MEKEPWKIVGEELLLSVKVIANAGRNGFGGLRDSANGGSALVVRVCAAPEKGKANKAVITLLAKGLKISRSAISVAMGDTSRNKILRISPPYEHVLEVLEKMRKDERS
jgi:uncharacterized protein (TIGR00251 family)